MKTPEELERKFEQLTNSDLPTSRTDPIIQVSGFGVENTYTTQCNYMLVGLTKYGKVLLSTGDGTWCDVSPKNKPQLK